jgi:hypothetical protein
MVHRRRSALQMTGGLAAALVGAGVAVAPSAVGTAGTGVLRSLRVSVGDLSGKGTYTVDRRPGGGAHLTVAERFSWRLARRAAGLIANSDRGNVSVSVPLVVHVDASADASYIDTNGKVVAYTCTASRARQVRGKVRVIRTGSRVRLVSVALRQISAGEPQCSDAVAQRTFQWPTGTPWFSDQLVQRKLLTKADLLTRRVHVTAGPQSAPFRHDCSAGSYTPTCLETLSWTARTVVTVRLRRRRA